VFEYYFKITFKHFFYKNDLKFFGFHLLQMCRFFKISKFEISFVSFEQNMKKKKPHFKVDDF
jgi:hypothetical protein